MITAELQALRQNYSSGTLDEKNVLPDAVAQFTKWFDEAVKAEIHEPNIMVLATANVDFKPSARVVLLKGIEHGGFVFYTNYESRKGKEMLWNPYASLVFMWKELERQVRIEGRVEKISKEESEQYFNSRPAGSRIGAIASPQSTVVESREWLEKKYSEAEKQFASTPPVKPDSWGGYIVKPYTIEFWQGRPNRLHDRILYTWEGDMRWSIQRLAP